MGNSARLSDRSARASAIGSRAEPGAWDIPDLPMRLKERNAA
jgi:hypothetical protein